MTIYEMCLDILCDYDLLFRTKRNKLKKYRECNGNDKYKSYMSSVTNIKLKSTTAAKITNIQYLYTILVILENILYPQMLNYVVELDIRLFLWGSTPPRNNTYGSIFSRFSNYVHTYSDLYNTVYLGYTPSHKVLPNGYNLNYAPTEYDLLNPSKKYESDIYYMGQPGFTMNVSIVTTLYKRMEK